MKNAIPAIIVLGALLAGCATPAPSPTPTPAPVQVASQPRATPPPPSTAVPSPTPTMTPANPACVRATTEIPEGQNPTRFMNSGPASGCYDSVSYFLDDIALTWGEFQPGIVVTFWTLWPVDSHGAPIAPTPTSVPTYTLSGTVFFDYNGNGVRDGGEPPIEGVPVRVAGLSTTSGPDGGYSLAGVPGGTQHVYLESPTPDPATAFRYVNRFLGWVDIPAYEMHGVALPAQRVPDTQISPIDHPVTIAVNSHRTLDFALMQGFLTLPFRRSQVAQPFIFNYFDIIGVRLFDQDHDFWSTHDGIMLTYDGRYDSSFSPNPYLQGAEVHPGVGDSHNGLDFLIPVGTYVVSGAPTSRVSSLPTQDGELLAQLWFPDPVTPSNRFCDTYGHLTVQLVEVDQTTYRGQILALSGDTGQHSGGFPQLHFDLFNWSSRGSYHLDPFRCTLQLDPLPEDYWGSQVIYWTVDNNPQFP